MQPAAGVAQVWINEAMQNGLTRLRHLNIPVNTIVDVGAAAGTWTQLAKKLWPQCSFLLFEPLAERQDELKKLAGLNPDIFIVPYAAGKTASEAKFYVTADLDGSGVAVNDSFTENIRVVKQISISSEIERLKLKGPYIIKLDTHGYEVPIIEGCEEMMKDVSAFIIECYGFQVAQNSLLFWEMCRYMDKLGFRLSDIVDIMNRPNDGVFWQCDAFFIRNDHEVFSTAKYN